MKKRRLKIWPIIILVVFVILIFCIKDIYDSLKKKKQTEVKVVDTIKNYDYSLKENETSYYVGLFKSLKKELSKEKIDEEKYAGIISQMFLADFWNLDNKINKNDIGGVEFVYKDYQSYFIKSSKDTVYNYLENNIYGNRKQELPVVKEVKINKIEKKEYIGEKINDSNAYYIDLKVIYKKDLDYQSNVKLILIHSNNKLEIVNMK